MIRVTTGSRLHFGLLRLPPAEPWPACLPESNIPARYYGGVGLMIDEPGVEITFLPAADWQFAGPLADRARSFAESFRANSPEIDISPQRIEVIHHPPEHA